MSKLGEFLAWKLNQSFPTLKIHQGLETAKRSETANQHWAYAEMQRVVPGFHPYWNLAGKHILDIGTGLGGKLKFYIDADAKSVTGVDISPGSLATAHKYTDSLAQTSNKYSCIHLSLSDAAHLPFPTDHFDTIVSINVFEHIANVEGAVLEAYRVLKPRGLAFLHFNPYYSPWGPHLESWIHFPWPHLLFSDQTLLRVAEREDRKRGLNADFVESARIDWSKTNGRIPDVNRVTLRRFKRLVRQAGFRIQLLRLLPVGYESLQSNVSPFKRMAYSAVRLGAHIPLAQEIVVTKMAYVLRKPNE